MNKTRKSAKSLNAKRVCLKTLNSKQFKNGMSKIGVSINSKKLKKNKPFMKEFIRKCTQKLNQMFHA